MKVKKNVNTKLTFTYENKYIYKIQMTLLYRFLSKNINMLNPKGKIFTNRHPANKTKH